MLAALKEQTLNLNGFAIVDRENPDTLRHEAIVVRGWGSHGLKR
jgi:hypothetical protein